MQFPAGEESILLNSKSSSVWGGGGGGSTTKKTEKTDNKTKFSKFLAVFVFFSTFFRENVANLTVLYD